MAVRKIVVSLRRNLDRGTAAPNKKLMSTRTEIEIAMEYLGKVIALLRCGCDVSDSMDYISHIRFQCIEFLDAYDHRKEVAV